MKAPERTEAQAAADTVFRLATEIMSELQRRGAGDFDRIVKNFHSNSTTDMLHVIVLQLHRGQTLDQILERCVQLAQEDPQGPPNG